MAKSKTSKALTIYNKIKPKDKVISKLQASLIARTDERKQQLLREREVAKLSKEGHSLEVISDKLGVSTAEAFELQKSVIQKWATETALDAKLARELDLKRLDALLVILHREAEPHQLVNPEDGKPVIDGITGYPVMTPPNLSAVKLILEVTDRRAKLLGLESQSKIVEDDKGQVVRREFVGVNPDKL